MENVLKCCPTLQGGYSTPPLLRVFSAGTLQTILSYILGEDVGLVYRRGHVSLRDGGTLALDWLDIESDDSWPTLLLLHGLSGGR